MDRIARAVEPSLGYRHELPERERRADASARRCRTRPATSPRRCGAKAILVPTFSGRTASVVARLRPRRPIIALTHHDYAVAADGDRVGRDAFLIPECDDVETLLATLASTPRGRAGLVDDGRPRRDHRRHRRQHARLDQRDQGRRRVGSRAGAAKRAAWPSVPASVRRARAPAALGRTRRDRARRAPLRRPLQSYVDAKHELAQRTAGVRALRAEKRELQHRLAESSTGER